MTGNVRPLMLAVGLTACGGETAKAITEFDTGPREEVDVDAPFIQHVPHCRLGGRHIVGHDDAFAGSQAVRLNDDRCADTL